MAHGEGPVIPSELRGRLTPVGEQESTRVSGVVIGVIHQLVRAPSEARTTNEAAVEQLDPRDKVVSMDLSRIKGGEVIYLVAGKWPLQGLTGRMELSESTAALQKAWYREGAMRVIVGPWTDDPVAHKCKCPQCGTEF